MNIIYKTINKINGKIYIGKHVQDGSEFDGYLGSGSYLKNAIKKYGKENFIRETLEVVEDEKLINEREIFWIAELKSTDSDVGYNLTRGGDGQSSEFMINMWDDEEFRNTQ